MKWGEYESLPCFLFNGLDIFCNKNRKLSAGWPLLNTRYLSKSGKLLNLVSILWLLCYSALQPTRKQLWSLHTDYIGNVFYRDASSVAPWLQMTHYEYKCCFILQNAFPYVSPVWFSFSRHFLKNEVSNILWVKHLLRLFSCLFSD